MSRRTRAIGFAALALLCAGLAAVAAGGYRGGIEAQLGELRPVVVARGELKGGHPLSPRDAGTLLAVRRVPARFAPADGLADPTQAIGREPAAPIPAGAYVTETQLRLPRRKEAGRRPHAGGSGQAVEVTVTGAEALAAEGGRVEGARVDVVVTTEPRGAGPGRTRVLGEGLRLLALREAGPSEDAGGLGPGGPGAWVATLAAPRPEALRLIQAHNYAREIRLIASERA